MKCGRRTFRVAREGSTFRAGGLRVQEWLSLQPARAQCVYNVWSLQVTRPVPAASPPGSAAALRKRNKVRRRQIHAHRETSARWVCESFILRVDALLLSQEERFFKCVFLIFTVLMIYSWCIGDVFGPQRTRVLRGDSSSRVSAQEVCGKFPADFKLMKRFNLISFSPGRTNDTRLEGTVLLI